MDNLDPEPSTMAKRWRWDDDDQFEIKKPHKVRNKLRKYNYNLTSHISLKSLCCTLNSSQADLVTTVAVLGNPPAGSPKVAPTPKVKGAVELPPLLPPPLPPCNQSLSLSLYRTMQSILYRKPFILHHHHPRKRKYCHRIK